MRIRTETGGARGRPRLPGPGRRVLRCAGAGALLLAADQLRRRLQWHRQVRPAPADGARQALDHLSRHNLELERQVQHGADQLRHREAELRSTFADALVGMVVIDADPARAGRVIDVNPAFCECTGYRREQLLGRILNELAHPDDAATGMRLYVALAVGEIDQVVTENRFVDAAGRTIWARMHVRAVRGQGRRAVRMLMQVEDISAAHAAQQALHDSEERFRRLAEVAPDIVFRRRWVPDPAYEYMSPATTDITGYAPEEFYADPGLIMSIVHPEDRAAAMEIPCGPAVDQVFRLYRKDGQLRWFHRRARVIFQDEVPVGCEGITRDITDTKIVEEQLRASEGRFRRLAENAVDVIYRMRISPDFRFEYISPAFAAFTGYPVDAFYADARLAFRLVHEDDRRRFMSLGTEADAMGPVLVRYLHGDGSVHWSEHRVVRVTEPDGTVALEGIARDFTERMRTEEQLRNVNDQLRRTAVQLEAASRYKSQFLANVSHELRSPLNSLLILAELLAADRDGTLTPEQLTWAESIVHAGREITVLINDVLDLAKIEAGKMDIDMADVALADALESVVALLRPVADQKRVLLSASVAAGLPAHIRADAVRLSQVLRNLLSNACKFTEAGSVLVEVFRRQDSPGGPNWIAFAVTDTGIGIRQDKLTEIFEAFRQADGTTTRRFGGTGLGLSISLQLARLMGGHIEVRSCADPAEGRTGSTFTLVLPLVASAGPPIAQARDAIAPPRTVGEPVVLIVEDDSGYGYLERMAAIESGWAAVLATGGAAAISAVRASRPDAVVLDVNLPGEDGLDVWGRMRALGGLEGVPVVFVSGFEEAGDRLPPGVSYRRKPDTMSGLLEIFRDLKVRVAALPVSRLPNRPSGQGRAVLVVDDDQRNRTALSSLLCAHGYEAVQASNAADALRLLVGLSHCGAVLMDVMMPEIDGYEATRRIRALPRNADIPVVGLTAKAMAGDAELAFAAGMDAYLTKPLDTSRLLRTLARLLPGPPVEPGQCAEATG